ncbi:GrpB family protein [Halobacillus sp. BAB-2008]|uniref:GrpB family protein n=1 Tax=Halobacillus sp. BAB-2008 TaxID=1246484 RepID=UPI0002A4F144|nr:GrpB family protein [Halobacillus sp. BAB-2008]ELK44353.1 hypothetical protein D479_19503 [Halobacillus sp. BAB-2008]
MVNRAMNVMVKDYEESWPVLFKEEAEKLRAVWKGELAAIHHIGSTAVPGLKAKPVIDIMPVVEQIEKVDDYNESLLALGYEPLGEMGIPGRRYFRKGGENRTHQIHVFQKDNHHEIDRHLAVRDYLRAHEEAAAAYGALKASLALEFPKDIAGYSAGKDDFVKELERKALDWKKDNL